MKLPSKLKKPLDAPTKVGPISTGTASVDQAINTELSFYNKTGNMLALWVVYDLCRKHSVKLPSDVQNVFDEMASAMAKLALEKRPEARAEAADIVLGTQKDFDPAGSSVFESYADHKRRRAIVDRVFALLMENFDAPPDQKIERKNQRSQTEIYEMVAEELDLAVDTIKKLFEQDEREAGPFAYRKIRGAAGEI